LSKFGQPGQAAAGFVFPGRNPARRLYGMALLLVLRRMGRADVTPHGFRSTFRDWAAERTNFPREVVEMALAHAIVTKSRKPIVVVICLESAVN
jgi:integrase